MLINETIAAIATPLSSAGIGIIRISGPDALEVIDKIYKSKNKHKVLSTEKTHTIHYGHIVNKDQLLDEVLVSIMRGPNSYTGEDVVEINCHGGIFVLQKVLDLVVNSGTRPAEPGEFTKRAFLNGKIDLSQAEAVMDVIDSKNEYALKSSVNQLQGNVQKKISDIRNEILYHTAFIESALDDPEHISLDGYGDKLKKSIQPLNDILKRLIDSSENGRIMKEGIKTVILGKPNAGKSSLLNVLVGEERAIVTNVEGTTRDTLEETINLDGISLNVVDTAGIRDTDDLVEQIGVNRAKDYAKDADLLIFVIDSSRDLDDNDKSIYHILKDKKAIILLNKSDLEAKVKKEDLQNIVELNGIPIVSISAKNEEGMIAFEEIVKEMFFEGKLSFNDEIYITNLRQKNALQNANNSLLKVLESIEMSMPEDFYSIDLLDAYEALGTITGETIGEDLVNEIFSKFCMGK